MAYSPYVTDDQQFVQPDDPNQFQDPNNLDPLGQVDVAGLPAPFGGGKNSGITGGTPPPSATPAPAPSPAAAPAPSASGDPAGDFMRIAGQYAPSANNLEQFVFPAFAQMYPGWTMKRNASGYVDAIVSPTGQIYDTQQNAGPTRSDAWQFNLAGGPGFVDPSVGRAGEPAAGVPTLPTPAGATSPSLTDTLTKSLLAQFGGATGNANNAALNASLREAIQQLIGQGMQTGLPDTGSSPQAQQFALTSQREADRLRSNAMEQRSLQPGGTGSGAAAGDVEGIQQARAEAQAKFEAGLTDKLLTERQQKLSLALQTGAGLLNADQERALRAELASVDAALQQNRLQLDWYQSQNQNQQFYDDLGFRIGTEEANLNSDAVTRLM